MTDGAQFRIDLVSGSLLVNRGLVLALGRALTLLLLLAGVAGPMGGAGT